MLHDTPPPLLYGISCTLRSSRLRAAVKRTLQQIQASAPDDCRRLQILIRGIHPYYGNKDDGTLGQWFAATTYEDYLEGEGEAPGVVKITETIPKEAYTSTIAHEFGHAATRVEDLERGGE